jgi:hypothetical protein
MMFGWWRTRAGLEAMTARLEALELRVVDLERRMHVEPALAERLHQGARESEAWAERRARLGVRLRTEDERGRGWEGPTTAETDMGACEPPPGEAPPQAANVRGLGREIESRQ